MFSFKWKELSIITFFLKVSEDVSCTYLLYKGYVLNCNIFLCNFLQGPWIIGTKLL